MNIITCSVWTAVALISTLLACQHAVARTAGCLRYSPVTVNMTGEMKAVQKFGPPNFGETPATDEQVTVPVLHLNQLVDVCGDPTSDVNPDTAVKVQDVRIIFATAGGDAKPWYGRRVMVAGTLMASHTAYHHTPVVMLLKSIAPTERR